MIRTALIAELEAAAGGELNLKGKGLRIDDAQLIAEAVAKNCYTKIDLSDNLLLETEGAAIVAEALKGDKTVKSLNVSECRIKSLKALSDLVRNNATLNILNLGTNFWGTNTVSQEEAEAFCEALKENLNIVGGLSDKGFPNIDGMPKRTRPKFIEEQVLSILRRNIKDAQKLISTGLVRNLSRKELEDFTNRKSAIAYILEHANKKQTAGQSPAEPSRANMPRGKDSRPPSIKNL